ncbi:MAG TPA: bifunctional UDP-N-acetylglucosamine diphosphorylase/glucosamine-1-phosphate N-acetyltransferase GlmU [Candidatus Saccharimonadales bacterium]|jgi:bifunctional UDP-N-acetylglucosamine pyrophosphorylase/glucosamine-1-phosphate N-acetyltransferase|nr:bifunctional UDP-N-acetylglucosamine diphosphorylase/glucosamine-1-phosphate N-acetyltransferase GlmU [Candidatus Saccharimonadales bacterium]
MPPSAVQHAGAFAIAIMAAGKGTRLKSARPKVLHEAGGMPLLAHVIAAASQVVAVKDIHVIVGHQAELVRAAVEHTGVRFVLQAEQRGTGHAIMCARSHLEAYENLLVLSGDVPLVKRETIEKLRDFHLARKAAMTILTAEPEDPFGYGRIVRATPSSDTVKQIVEQKMLKGAQQKLREINSGIYAFDARRLFANLDRLTADNPSAEFYLTDMAAILMKAKARVLALKAPDAEEVLGANTLAELAGLDADLRFRKCQALMDSGVSIYRPDTCVIDSEVQVGADTILEPFVQLLGRTRIGSNCRVRSYSIISDSQIEDRVMIKPGCIVDQSHVASDAVLGPYSHLRPASQIGQGAHVGNFVETKKTKLGRGAKANHLTYLGDSEIGEGVNVGAGTITCNYDGTHKHVTVIEEGAFIGSNSILVAPLRIGKGAYVAAGSTITQDVPEDALAFGRATQVVKPGWAKERRQHKQKRTPSAT